MMKLIFENYRKHLHEQEINELRTQILNEISADDYDMIKKWMRDAPDEAYSFRNLFGNKKRIAIPVETGAADGPIGEIVRLFEDNGWKIDFKDSLVSKEITKTIPKGPKAGEKITQTKKMRIGKALLFAEDLMKKYMKFVLSSAAIADDILPTGGPPSDAQKKAKAAFDKIKEEFPNAQGSELALRERIPKLIEFWNEKSEFYRQNPDAAFQQESPYVTILSRHPVDVVRMSDMNNITSCHSRNAGYFQCAVAESRGHGPIAYLVPREQFEEYFGVDLSETDPSEVDLDEGDEEIFEDRGRNIYGLKPEGRVRLRKFVSKEDGRMITAPERRTYAPHDRRTPPNFLKGVTQWAMDSQKNIIGDPKKLANEFYKEEWVRHGGSYEDTQDGEVMAAMLEPHLSGEELNDLGQAGNMPQSEEEDEEQIERELDETSEERQAERIQEEADRLTHFNVWHDIDEGIMFSGGFGFDLDEELGEFPDGWELHEAAINDAVIQALDQEAYIYVEENGEIEVRSQMYRIHINPADDQYSDLDGFSSFVSSLEDADDKFTDIMNNVRDQLTEAGILEPTSLSVKKALDYLDKLRATVDIEEKLIRVSWKDRDRIITQVQDFKKYTAEEQDRIKKFFSVDFRNFVGDILNRLRKKFDFPLQNIVLLRERQKLSPELDGVYSILDFDLKYEDNGEMRKAAKMVEELNKGSYQKAIRQESFNAFYEAEKDVAKARRQLPPTTYQKMPAREQENTDDADARELNQLYESKKPKTSDKMLFESWRRYLDK